MTEHERELAENCYGYGRWAAPYWFIGPEQGQGGWEGGELAGRYQAFLKLNRDGLCDCSAFHHHIGESRWQGKLQSTWRRLILLLLAYKGLPVADSDLLRYQRTEWGSYDGETCVIELAGQPANSFNVPRDRKSFREARIERIVKRALAYRRKLIVVYGKSHRDVWKQVAEREPRLNFRFEPHPVYGPAKQYWIDQGTMYQTQD